MKSHKDIPCALNGVPRPFLLGLALLLAVTSATAAVPAIGEPAPESLGRDRQGQVLSLAGARGQVVVVTFWASWCAPCLDELAARENLQKRHGPAQLRVIAVNWREPLLRYRASLRQLGSVQLTLSRDEDGSVARAYGVDVVPRSFVVDRDGRLAFDNTGFETPGGAIRLAAQISRLLAPAADRGAHAIMPP